MKKGFHYEEDEGKYRLYFDDVFLGWFDTLNEVKHEIKIRKEHAKSVSGHAHGTDETPAR